jgi:hypothetical protein
MLYQIWFLTLLIQQLSAMHLNNNVFYFKGSKSSLASNSRDTSNSSELGNMGDLSNVRKASKQHGVGQQQQE